MSFQMEDLPEVERLPASHTQMALSGLVGYTDNFGAALKLFYSISVLVPATPAKWPSIMGRDGAMTLYHYSETLKAVRSSVKQIPTLKPHIDHNLLRGISKEFHKNFPHVELIRNSVAHSAELVKSIEAVDRTAIKNAGVPLEGLPLSIEEGGSAIIRDCFFSNKYLTTIGGKLLSYDLDQDKHSLLIRLTNTAHDAFPMFRHARLDPEDAYSNPY